MSRSPFGLRWLLLLVVAWACLPAARAEQTSLPTFEEALAAEPTLSLFAKLVDADREPLATDEPFTIFAPSNEALEQSDFAPVESRIEVGDTKNIRRIVAGHFVKGTRSADDLAGLATRPRRLGQLRTALGSSIGVRTLGDGPALGPDRARIVKSIATKTGIVHVIDGLLVKRARITPDRPVVRSAGYYGQYRRYYRPRYYYRPRQSSSRPNHRAPQIRRFASEPTPLTPQEESLNAFFPWPPPQPTASFVFPQGQFGELGKSSLLDAERRITTLLTSKGYGDRLYFAQPGGSGFVILTRLERITDGGASAADERWSTAIRLGRTFSLADYARAVFGRLSGRFRLIVLVVTRDSVKTTTAEVDQPMIEKWKQDGITTLPRSFSKIPLTEDYAVHALVYEFARQQDKPMTFVAASASSLDSKQHMQGAGLLEDKR